MMDQYYFKELVIHPPPMNFFSMFLIPFAVSKNAMIKMGKYFSKIMFWLENIPYIGCFLIYEVALAPIIFMKILFNILIQASCKMLPLMTLFWLVLGLPMVILFGVGFDTFNYLRVLCTTKDD